MTKLIELNRMDPARAPEQTQELVSWQDELARRKRIFRPHMLKERLAWQAGDTLALARAIYMCRVCHEPPPRWLTNAIFALIATWMPAAEQRQYNDLGIHKERWGTVVQLRAAGTKWKDCWEAALEKLAGTAARGGKDTMERSYKIIQKAGGKGATLESFRLASKQYGNK